MKRISRVRVVDSPVSELFEPGIVLRALSQFSNYYLIPQGLVHDVVMIQVVHKKDRTRSYEVWCDPCIRDGRMVLVPFQCECMDASCRKRLCKHCAWFCIVQRVMSLAEAEERATVIEIGGSIAEYNTPTYNYGIAA